MPSDERCRKPGCGARRGRCSDWDCPEGDFVRMYEGRTDERAPEARDPWNTPHDAVEQRRRSEQRAEYAEMVAWRNAAPEAREAREALRERLTHAASLPHEWDYPDGEVRISGRLWSQLLIDLAALLSERPESDLATAAYLLGRHDRRSDAEPDAPGADDETEASEAECLRAMMDALEDVLEGDTGYAESPVELIYRLAGRAWDAESADPVDRAVGLGEGVEIAVERGWLTEPDAPGGERPRLSRAELERAYEAAAADPVWRAEQRARTAAWDATSADGLRERPGGEREPEFMDAIELAWGIIANASGGDWERQSPEWQEAARRWRDRFLPLLVPPATRPAADPDLHGSSPMLTDCDGGE